MVSAHESGFNIAYFAFDQFIPSEHAGFVHTYSIVKALKYMGNNVVIYGIPGRGDLFNIFKWKGFYDEIKLNYVRFPASFKLKYKMLYPLNVISYYKTLDSLRIQNPDLIHERFHLPNPYSIKIWEKVKTPKVLEVNSLYIEEGVYANNAEKIASKHRKKLFNQCKAIITQTKTLKKMVEKIADKPVFVVPNGVDTDRFRPDVSQNDFKKSLAPDNEIVITFVGSFRKWHGVDQISRIAENFRKDNVRFLLIGSGELFEEVRKKKTSNMTLLGAKNHSEIPKYLACSDVLIAPFDDSYFKGSDFWWNPVKLFEYMASGKPVVSYDYEEIKNILSGSGLLAEPGDLAGFTEKLRSLIEDEDVRRELGRRGREIAVREYDWKRQAERTVEVYNQIL